MKKIVFLTTFATFLITCLMLIFAFNGSNYTHTNKHNKPKIAFTFDDGSTKDFGGYPLRTWNEMLLNSLEKHHVKSILFSTGNNKIAENGKYILSSWNDAGHKISNHTFSHPNFNKTTIPAFKYELIKNDSLINNYSNFYPYFRFPYLKEGDTKEKVFEFRQFLKDKGYKNGHVTIDASDWYVDSRLVKRLNEDSKSDVSGFREYYKNHLLDRANYYDSLSYLLTNRRINHVLLLHHNLAAALFLDDLIKHFKSNGWEVIDADKAYLDDIYREESDAIPAGESLIWSLAKKTGRFDNLLRYPAEDSRYEKSLMDSLGL